MMVDVTFPRIPTPAEVDEIARRQEPISRNLQITQCYHELSAVLAARTAGSANWCTFATWASKQAGQTIRQEDLRRAVEGALHDLPGITQAMERLLTLARQLGAKPQKEDLRQLVWELLNPMAAIERASKAVARGNQKVFEEIGREFADFFANCGADQSFREEAIEVCGTTLRPGDPPEGQGYLQKAFRRYYQAMFEPETKKRAELLLGANIEIGFHEQTRLQPEIVASLDAAILDPEEFVRRLVEVVIPGGGWLALGRVFFLRLLGRLTPLREAAAELVAAIRGQLHVILTEYMMSLALPHGVTLRLGRDLQKDYPSSLRELQNPEVRALVEKLDPTPDSTQATGALDWADLPERLHFIIDFFRSYQEAAELLEPPFSATQVIALKAGQIPEGEL
jgi:hypothetical protein